MKKINYRVRDAIGDIKDALSYDDKLLAEEATDYIGKEFNTARAYKLIGRRSAFKEALEFIRENNLNEYL